MSLRDLRVLAEGHVVHADVCIVGGGPAGLTLARELSDADADVVLLESGGRDFDPWTDALNDIDSVGAERVMDQTLVRNRVLGGTSATWSGRVATFGRLDFEKREWVSGSGWPIARAELVPYFERSLPHLGIVIAENSEPPPPDPSGRRRSGVDPRYLSDYVWSYSKDVANRRDFLRLGPRAESDDLAGVRGFLHATVTHIDTTPDGAVVTGLEVAGADGLRRRVEARYTVLCAGGIENARLLLASNRIVRCGVGNRDDVVGRYLADHPRGPVGYFEEADLRAVQERFGSHHIRVRGQQVTLTVGLTLSPQVQESEKLLNCSMWVSGVPAADDPFASISDLLRMRNPRRNLVNVVRGARLVGAGTRRYLLDHRSPVRRLSAISLQAMVEQEPNRDSRLTLGDRTDAFGLPISRIDWRIGEAEARTVRRAAGLFASEMARLGAPRPRLVDMITDGAVPFMLPDVAHPSGTTRMSADPRTGVVDEQCAVHGVDGLFVAGSSVFPTNGHANPTQMIVAMAVRLADEVKRRLADDRANRPPAGPEPVQRVGQADRQMLPSTNLRSDDQRPTVLVTGASGKVGRALTPLLLQRGFAVRALTSRMRVLGDDPVDWRVRDLRRDDLDFTDEVSGVAAVVHLGAELRHEADMYRTNVEATAALAAAAAAEGVGCLVFASSISAYGSAASRASLESSEVLTADVDIPAQYWGNSALRTYGRTKVLAERAVSAVAHRLECVIFRPTVIVDTPEIVAILRWNKLRQTLLSYRRTHHIYVHDVAEAIVWALERSLSRPAPVRGASVYNLSDDEAGTFANLFDEARAASPGRSVERVVRLPAVVDWTKDFLRYRGGWPVRRPLGLMSFPNDKLIADGFRFRHGMAAVRTKAFDQL